MLGKASTLRLRSLSNIRPFSHTVATTSLPTVLTLVRTSSSISGRLGSSVFTGKGTLYTLETSELNRIAQLLAHHRLRTWGFVVYRCTYDDDAAWTRFMDYLNRSRDSLPLLQYGVEDPDDDVPPGLVRRLGWRVQEDPIGLDGASKDEVRRRFRKLVSSHLQPEESNESVVSSTAKLENPRWNFCVHVDKDSLNSVLQDPPAGSTDRLSRRRYVNLIRADSDWDLPDYDRFDWTTHSRPADPEEDDPHDENEEQIDGSRRYDVGWTKVQVHHLIPSLYDSLMRVHQWDPLYRRPPEIAGW